MTPFATLPVCLRQADKSHGLHDCWFISTVETSFIFPFILPGRGSKLINAFSDDISDTQSWRNREING